MVKQKDEILLTEQGFFFGHKLKDGSINKGARRIEEAEIMTMFAQFFEAYCAENETDHIAIKAADGFTIFAKHIETESGQPEG